MILIIVGICLIVVLLKFTSRGRASLLSVARRAILPYINRNQHAAEQIRTNQLSVAQFHNAAGEEGSRNPTEGNEPGGVLPYMGYIGMCGPKGYGFSAVLVINRVSIIAILPPLWS